MIDKLLEDLESGNSKLPSLIHDVRAVLEEKGLDDNYIYGKLVSLSVAKSNLELLAMTRFLDMEGRMMLAARKDYSFKELNAYYTVSGWYSNSA